jgi:hypothetical protein
VLGIRPRHPRQPAETSQAGRHLPGAVSEAGRRRPRPPRRALSRTTPAVRQSTPSKPTEPPFETSCMARCTGWPPPKPTRSPTPVKSPRPPARGGDHGRPCRKCWQRRGADRVPIGGRRAALSTSVRSTPNSSTRRPAADAIAATRAQGRGISAKTALDNASAPPRTAFSACVEVATPDALTRSQTP